MKNYVLLSVFHMGFSAYSQQSGPTKLPDKMLGEKTVERIEEVQQKYEEEVSVMAQRRKNSSFSVLGIYAPLTTWIPSKLGLSFNFIRNTNWTYEVEGLYGSINYEFLGVKLSSFTETQVSLLARYYPSNSFNLFFGMQYENLELVLGDALISTLSGVDTTEYRLLKLSNVGVALGLGNRWLFEEGFTLGIDWITLNQPLIPLNTDAKFLSSNASQSDKDAVDRGISILKYMPRITILKIALGWTF